VLLATILDAAPDAHGVLFDQASVVAEARATLADSPLAARLDLVPGDFFDHVPAGGDAYVLSRVLHDWDDDSASRILSTCRRSMDDGSRLLIADSVLPELARDDPGAIRMDVLMFLLLRSRERTEDEFRRLLAANGFELDRVIPTGSPGGLALVEAHPVGVRP